MPNPTMQDIADHAGVSRAAVSMALRDHPGVSKATRERIKKIAVDLGYTPNPMISALMSNLRTSGKSGEGQVLAYLILRTRGDWQSLHIHRDFLQGVRERATDLGFRIEVFVAENSVNYFKRLSRILTARGIHGVVVGPVSDERTVLDRFLEDFQWDHFCLVNVGGIIDRINILIVRHNHFDGMKIAFLKALEFGHKRVGFVCGESLDWMVRHRWTASYLFHQQQLNPRDRLPVLLYNSASQADMEGKVKEWYVRHKPTVIISLSGKHIMRINSLRSDVSHICLSYNNEFPAISGVCQRAEAIGSTAVDLLAAKLNHNVKGFTDYRQEYILQGAWMEGSTLRPLN